jgi:DNA-binding transcriptional MerR regulator
MHDIQDLMRILGYDKPHKLRERLDAFKAVLGDSLKRGAKNKVLVDNNGLMILRRAKELEESGHTLREVARLLEAELKGHSAEDASNGSETASITDLKRQWELLLREKDRRIAQLEGEVEFLRGRILTLEEVLQDRLPPSQEEIRANLQQKVSRWERFKQLLRGE